MTVERYLSLRIKNWRSKHFSSKKAALVGIGVVIGGICFNIHTVFTINYNPPLNKTFDGGCYSDSIHETWQYVNIIYSS